MKKNRFCPPPPRNDKIISPDDNRKLERRGVFKAYGDIFHCLESRQRVKVFGLFLATDEGVPGIRGPASVILMQITTDCEIRRRTPTVRAQFGRV